MLEEEEPAEEDMPKDDEPKPLDWDELPNPDEPNVLEDDGAADEEEEAEPANPPNVLLVDPKDPNEAD